MCLQLSTALFLCSMLKILCLYIQSYTHFSLCRSRIIFAWRQTPNAAAMKSSKKTRRRLRLRQHGFSKITFRLVQDNKLYIGSGVSIRLGAILLKVSGQKYLMKIALQLIQVNVLWSELWPVTVTVTKYRYKYHYLLT